VFVNLFSNAADAMAGITDGYLIIRTNLVGNNVTIDVLDNGTGLSESDLKKIWDPFFTTKPVGKGTGLGMSISYGIIESHGGTILAKNRPEGGAAFLITLPTNS
jgi:two-component system, NtrC family, sensor histidine kinase HupT/HoxJ